jgi:hypothetical protein
MQGPKSIIVPLNVPVLAAGATWPNSAQPTSQSPMFKMNNNQINDAIRVLIFAIYGLTLNILESNDNSTWTSLYSEANTAGQLLDSGWINPTMRYFQVQIVNGATQQGGNIYANGQQANPAPIDARLALYMQEPEMLSGITDVALSGSTVVRFTFQIAITAPAAGSVLTITTQQNLVVGIAKAGTGTVATFAATFVATDAAGNTNAPFGAINQLGQQYGSGGSAANQAMPAVGDTWLIPLKGFASLQIQVGTLTVTGNETVSIVGNVCGS